MLRSSYMGRRLSPKRIEEVLSQVDVAWLMADLCRRVDEKINILQVSKIGAQKRCGKTIEALISATSDVLEDMPDCLIVDEEKIVKVFIERRKSRCFQCGLKKH